MEQRTASRSAWRWRAATLGLGCLVIGLVVGAAGQAQPAPQVVGVAAGDRFLYRVWSDGAVDRLNVSGSVKTAKGIPTWGRLKIDPQLKQVDQMLE